MPVPKVLALFDVLEGERECLRGPIARRRRRHPTGRARACAVRARRALDRTARGGGGQHFLLDTGTLSVPRLLPRKDPF